MAGFITDLERKVIENILNSEYMDVTGEQMVNWAVWSFSVTNKKTTAEHWVALLRKDL